MSKEFPNSTNPPTCNQQRKVVEQFVSVLNNTFSRTHKNIYDNSGSFLNKPNSLCKYKANDVISSVASTVKAIQGGDNVRVKRNVLNKLKRYKTSNFVPVCLLKCESEVLNKQSVAKFETQCVSDTQLMNLIQGAEAMYESHKGMTQEFETSFHSLEQDTKQTINKNIPPDIEDDKLHQVNLRMKKEVLNVNSDKYIITCESNSEGKNVQSKEIKEQDEILIMNDNIVMDNEKTVQPLSPILNSNSILNSISQNSFKSLVFNLDAFEKFESIVMPLVSHTENYRRDATKCLINSQIIGKELYLHINNNYCNTKIVEENVEEINIEITPENIADKEVKLCSVPNKCTNHKDDDISFNSCMLEDDILFSSDEDDHYKHNDAKNLPFTCALESSDYDNESDIFDKTIYVGFTTASNKSIQVMSDSFVKAKEMLDEIQIEESIMPSLAQLVEISSKVINAKTDDNFTNEGKTDFKMTRSSIVQVTDKFQDLIGLPTTSNKNICVLEKDFGETKGIFQNMDDYVKQSLTSANFDMNSGRTLKGFSTASNKKIAVSDEALAKTRNLFQDIDSIGETKPISINIDKNLNTAFKGFSTASNKKITVSDEALAKTRNLFQDIDGIGETKPISTNIDKNLNTAFKGFSTASNKKITVSDEALAKTRNLFQDIDGIGETKPISTNIDKNLNTAFKGFSTASNKKITVSDEALAKTRNLFQDIDGIGETKPISTNIDKNLNTAFKGFSTASNKKITVSDEALAKTRNLFQDIDGIGETKPISTNIDKNLNTAFKGFSTASNKKITVSDEALAKTRNLFQDIDGIGETKPISTNIDKNLNTAFKGFSTASNKKITVSDEALAKTRNLFQNIDGIGETKPISTNIDKNLNTAFKGFSTASNKKITVSDEALAKTRNLFQDIDGIGETKPISTNIDKNLNTAFKGFSTASNKKITVSDETLAKTRNLFQDIDGIGETKPISTNIDKNLSTTFNGFSTASNKKITVSDEALAKTRNLFQNIDGIGETKPISTNIDKNLSTTFNGFSTASNKKITVSDEALAKTRNLFQDIDGIGETKPISTNIDKNLNTAFKGFSTASNKKITVSDEALAKTRNLFQDIVTIGETKSCIPADVDMKLGSKFKGFSTANNKKITVSDEALAKTRNLFQNIDGTINDAIQEKEMPSNSRFIGFSAANNKTIETSKEALLKTKHLFNHWHAGHESHEHENGEKRIESEKKAKICKVDTEALDRNSNFDMKNDNMEIDDYLNSQVINNFDQTLYTEDFRVTQLPKQKRCGSPILPCTIAKKRKIFKTPFKKDTIKINKIFVENKSKNQIKPSNVYTFNENYKKRKTSTLKELKMHSGNTEIDAFISKWNLDNFQDMEFVGARNPITHEKMTIGNLKDLFKASVDGTIIPKGWLDIHLKLILWKLVSYEIKFPTQLALVCNSREVMEQLKYRYDRELNKSERPALRKIYERDESSARSMVLCVLKVYVDGSSYDGVSINSNSILELELTDGWYSIRTTIDKLLSRMVACGKILVGTKLMVNGAELLHCDQGISPWEDTSSVRLKVSGNAARRARWATRLGFHGDAAMLVALGAVRAGGGRAASRALAARVYPALYIEKFDDGSTVTRTERQEQAYQLQYESERQACIERVCEEVEKEYADQEWEGGSGGSQKRRSLDSGSQVAKWMKSKDSQEARSHLTDTQMNLLSVHNDRRRERLREEIQEKVEERMKSTKFGEQRNVVSLLKVRLVGISANGDSYNTTTAILSIWKPSDALLEVVKEGVWLEIMNFTPTTIRNNELHISAGRQSVFRIWKPDCDEKMIDCVKKLTRRCSTIEQLNQPNAIIDNEIDTSGLIFAIEPSTIEFQSSRVQNFQNVYLSDGSKNFLCINFWGGVKKWSFENVLEVGHLVACVNLQARVGNTRKSTPHFRVTEFTYFTKTPKNNANKLYMERLRVEFDKIDVRQFCERCVVLKNKLATSRYATNENQSPYRFMNTSEYSLHKNKIYIESPLARNVARDNPNKEDLNLTGLDFETTFKQTDTQALSPNALLRKSNVNKRIAKLKIYGEPPPLKSIHLNKSTHACGSYKSPFRDDVSNSVASGKNVIDNSKIVTDNTNTSPVLNKCCVKRGFGNPIRLDFSNDINEESVNKLDPFSGEFDGSPPLSLE